MRSANQVMSETEQIARVVQFCRKRFVFFSNNESADCKNTRRSTDIHCFLLSPENSSICMETDVYARLSMSGDMAGGEATF